jgi:hypothetical protein
MGDSQATLTRRNTGRLWLWLGLCLPVLAIVAYAVQVSNAILTVPWYVPALATLGAILLIVAVCQKRTVWRILALVLIVILAGLEWAFMFAVRLPTYQGPVAVGKPFPAFATARADGTPFTERDLQGGPSRVLVFFRGRW